MAYHGFCVSTMNRNHIPLLKQVQHRAKTVMSQFHDQKPFCVYNVPLPYHSKQGSV